MLLTGEEEERQNLCLAQGHGRGLLVRITSRACIKSEVLTICVEKRRKKKRKDTILRCSVLCNTSHL